MDFNDYYENISQQEADLILDLYDVIKRLVQSGNDITLVRLGFELNIKPSELSEHIGIIISILDKVEKEYNEIQ